MNLIEYLATYKDDKVSMHWKNSNFYQLKLLATIVTIKYTCLEGMITSSHLSWCTFLTRRVKMFSSFLHLNSRLTIDSFSSTSHESQLFATDCMHSFVTTYNNY